MDGLGIGVTVLRDLLERQDREAHMAQERSNERAKGETNMCRITISSEPEIYEGESFQARYPFQDTASAIRFLKKNEGKWFLKVSGEGTELDTYEAPDSATMIRYLEWVQQHQATQAAQAQ